MTGRIGVAGSMASAAVMAVMAAMASVGGVEVRDEPRPLREHGKPRRSSWFNRSRGMRFPEQSERQARGRHQENRNPLSGFVTIGLKPGRERGLMPKD